MSDPAVAINLLTMRARAKIARLAGRSRMHAGKLIPYAVAAFSIIAGGAAILIAGTQLPQMKPKPLIIMVPARLPPPTAAQFGLKAEQVAAAEPPAATTANTETPVEQPIQTSASARQVVGFEPASATDADPLVPRVVVPGLVEPATVGTAAGLERVEPRAPLSELYATPQTDEKAMPAGDFGAGDQANAESWRMTRMFNPVASAAGRIEAKGHKMSLSGLEPLQIGEKCVWNGTDWPCGTVARTAFRSWLRARAVQCKVPSTPLPSEIMVECHIGPADIGEWLVSNGWARAAAGGPYVALGDRAKARNVGIYGAPPKRISVTLAPSGPTQAAGVDMNLEADLPHSTPDELNQDPQPGGLWPQIEP
jgi:endonuclease YncB( thermonuclease family)